MLFNSEALSVPLDEVQLHQVVFVLAGLEAEKECILLQHLTQLIIVCKGAMLCLNLTKTVEMRTHLLKVCGDQAFIWHVGILLLLVRLIDSFLAGVLEDLSLKRRFNDSEEPVLLLLCSALVNLLGSCYFLKAGGGCSGLLAMTFVSCLGLLHKRLGLCLLTDAQLVGVLHVLQVEDLFEEVATGDRRPILVI